MAKLSLLCVFATILAVAQTINAVPIEEHQAISLPNKLLEAIVAASENVYGGFKGLVDYSSNKDKIGQAISDYVRRMGGFITKAVLTRIEKQMDKMEPLACDNGKRAITCIRNEREPVLKSVNDSVDSITQCLMNQLPTVIEDSGDLMNAARHVLKIIADAYLKFKECSGENLCLLGLIGNLTKIRVYITALATGTSEVKRGLKQIFPKALRCFTEEKKKILRRTVDIFDDAVDCISG